LLQSLFANLVVLALLVEFDFLCVHVSDGVLELLQAEYAILSTADRGVVLGSVTHGGARAGSRALGRARGFAARCDTLALLTQAGAQLEVLLLKLFHFLAQDAVLSTTSDTRLSLGELLAQLLDLTVFVFELSLGA